MARPEHQLLVQHIAHCAQARDGRGRWRQQAALQQALQAGTTPAIAQATADAATRLGEHIARAGRRALLRATLGAGEDRVCVRCGQAGHRSHACKLPGAEG